MATTNLDMDVLRTLAAAHDLGGFARAAARLGRTQSAISLQMKKLEEQVGQPVFKKQGRGVALTDAGDVLLGYARRILALNDEAVSASRGIAVAGTVRLGVPQDLAEHWLPTVLSQFHHLHPHVHFEVHVGRGRDLRERVAQGGLDLSMAFSEVEASAGEHEALARLPLVWIGPRGFQIDPDAPVPLALLDSPCMFRQQGLAALDRVRRPWRMTFTSPSLVGLWGAISAGLGVTVRTALGVPETLSILDARSGLPALSSVSLVLYQSSNVRTPALDRLQSILLETLTMTLPAGSVSGAKMTTDRPLVRIAAVQIRDLAKTKPLGGAAL